jgi:ribosomal protein S18 acetylase RimI-like enzyme
MLQIRPYTPADERACLAICASRVPIFFAPRDLEEFRAFLRQPQGAYLVGTRDGTVRACGGYYVGTDGVAGLTWGMVHAEDQRRGFGTELLRYRLDRVHEHGRPWCVRLHTTPAITGFFQRFGFVQEAIVEDAYGPGLHQVTMRLLWRAAPATQAGNA